MTGRDRKTPGKTFNILLACLNRHRRPTPSSFPTSRPLPLPPLQPAGAQPPRLRLSDGPLSALSTVEAVVRGVAACRQWVEGATAIASGRGLDGASSFRLVQELQANRQLPYAVGGGLRTTLAHELSLKAPENPELAHHLGR